jgi:hypothetical protein
LIVLEGARHRLQQLTHKLENRCTISGWKVDCVSVSQESISAGDLADLLHGQISNNKTIHSFGKVKIEKKTFKCTKKIELKLYNTIEPPILYGGTKILDIPNESGFFIDKNAWNADMANIIKSHDRVRVEAVVPGAGKSAILKHTFPGALFVCPTNALTRDFAQNGYNAITIDRFFGNNIDDNASKMNPSYDITHISEIIFDEIYLMAMSHRLSIYNWITYGKKCDTKLFATGDISQLKNMADTENGFSDEDISRSVEILFQNKICLKRCKRGITEFACKMVDDFTKNFPHDSTERARKYVSKYFKIINDSREVKKIFRSGYQGIGNHEFNRRVKTLLNIRTFRKGRECVVRSGNRFISGQAIFNTNVAFLCVSVDDENVILKHHDFGNVALKTKVVERRFYIHESRTCESCQGLSKPKICLMGFGNQSARWLYTAVTRSRNFDDVVLIDTACLPPDPEKIPWEKIQSRIRGNLTCDKEKHFDVRDPITLSWVKAKWGRSQICGICREQIDSICEISIDRVGDNKIIGHEKHNCQLVHLACNIMKGRI